ncbi:hypothetical protein ACFWB1_26480 [Streptomyces goshikiensis]|uniref:hypothetical protein n=1 Tax=Streptomyces TaxID=1883 RepID=UPI000F42E94B|nr:hypothetical protein EES41_04155 [Streptomyces sp. ADI95-16]
MCHPAWARALTEAQRLKDLARPRRDRIDREYALPHPGGFGVTDVSAPVGCEPTPTTSSGPPHPSSGR